MTFLLIKMLQYKIKKAIQKKDRLDPQTKRVFIRAYEEMIKSYNNTIMYLEVQK